MASQPKNVLTLDEYLELERKSDTRTVYHKGEIFPIEAATEAHGILCVNAAAEIPRRSTDSTEKHLPGDR
jgi:hypothetical protein